MDNQTYILEWGSDCLVANGYSIKHQPEILLSTPWSTIARFSTTHGLVYLKQTPPAISLEPQIISILSDKFHASVPHVIAINSNLNCFMMHDSGIVLRSILKDKFSSELLCQSILQYAAIERSTEDHVETFIKLGVPDWRLDKLPSLYDEMINKTELLKAEGMTNQELLTLQGLRSQFLEQCQLLSGYGISETIGIPDFNDNNTLFNPNTKRLTFIDWGEAVITHPFFSLHNCLEQAVTHHNVKEATQVYSKLQEACLQNWAEFAIENKLISAFILSKQIRYIYIVLSSYRLMVSVDLQALNTFYANKPNRLAKAFRGYIRSCEK